MSNFTKILFAGLIIISSGCSSVEVQKNEVQLQKIEQSDLRITPLTTECWLNLMPNSKATFNIIGTLRLEKSLKYDFNNVRLDQVDIIQKGKALFSIKPQVQEKHSSELERELVYFTLKGIGLKPEFNSNENVNIRFRFRYGKDIFYHSIEKVEIQKVY